jgi:hypothetical protein
MRAALVVATLIAMVARPAYAAHDFSTTGGFIELYGNGESLIPRMYIRGIGDGIGMYNTMVQAEGGAGVYCPPNKVGIVDAQYVAIIKAFVAKVPKAKDLPVAGVLLYALKDAFPCQGQ